MRLSSFLHLFGRIIRELFESALKKPAEVKMAW